MRISVNVPATFAAILFFVAWLGSIGAIHINTGACRDAGLVFLALTGLVIFNRGSTQ